MSTFRTFGTAVLDTRDQTSRTYTYMIIYYNYYNYYYYRRIIDYYKRSFLKAVYEVSSLAMVIGITDLLSEVLSNPSEVEFFCQSYDHDLVVRSVIRNALRVIGNATRDKELYSRVYSIFSLMFRRNAKYSLRDLAITVQWLESNCGKSLSDIAIGLIYGNCEVLREKERVREAKAKFEECNKALQKKLKSLLEQYGY